MCPLDIKLIFVRGWGSGACSGLVTGWPGIAVPPGSAHFPTKTKRSSPSSTKSNPLLSQKWKIWQVICCGNKAFIKTQLWRPVWLFVQSKITKVASYKQTLIWLQKIYWQWWLLRWKTFSIVTFSLSAVWRRPWYRAGESWVQAVLWITTLKMMFFAFILNQY